MYVYICIRTGLDLRNEKENKTFCEIATHWQSDSQLRIIIRNVFGFLHHILKICLGGNFVQKSGGNKKRSFCDTI